MLCCEKLKLVDGKNCLATRQDSDEGRLAHLVLINQSESTMEDERRAGLLTIEAMVSAQPANATIVSKRGQKTA